jgi:hypothetical protein
VIRISHSILCNTSVKDVRGLEFCVFVFLK